MADERAPLLTMSQAARFLEVSVTRVRQLVLQGTLPAEETPLGRLFDQAELDRLKEKRSLAR